MDDEQLHKRLAQLLRTYQMTDVEFCKQFALLVGVPIQELNHVPAVAGPKRDRDPQQNRTQQFQAARAGQTAPQALNVNQQRYHEVLRNRIYANCSADRTLAGLITRMTLYEVDKVSQLVNCLWLARLARDRSVGVSRQNHVTIDLGVGISYSTTLWQYEQAVSYLPAKLRPQNLLVQYEQMMGVDRAQGKTFPCVIIFLSPETEAEHLRQHNNIARAFNRKMIGARLLRLPPKPRPKKGAKKVVWRPVPVGPAYQPRNEEEYYWRLENNRPGRLMTRQGSNRTSLSLKQVFERLERWFLKKLRPEIREALLQTEVFEHLRWMEQVVREAESSSSSEYSPPSGSQSYGSDSEFRESNEEDVQLETNELNLLRDSYYQYDPTQDLPGDVDVKWRTPDQQINESEILQQDYSAFKAEEFEDPDHSAPKSKADIEQTILEVLCDESALINVVDSSDGSDVSPPPDQDVDEESKEPIERPPLQRVAKSKIKRKYELGYLFDLADHVVEYGHSEKKFRPWQIAYRVLIDEEAWERCVTALSEEFTLLHDDEVPRFGRTVQAEKELANNNRELKLIEQREVLMKPLIGKRKRGDFDELLRDLSQESWENDIIQEETLEATSVQRDQLEEQIDTISRPSSRKKLNQQEQQQAHREPVPFEPPKKRLKQKARPPSPKKMMMMSSSEQPAQQAKPPIESPAQANLGQPAPDTQMLEQAPQQQSDQPVQPAQEPDPVPADPVVPQENAAVVDQQPVSPQSPIANPAQSDEVPNDATNQSVSTFETTEQQPPSATTAQPTYLQRFGSYDRLQYYKMMQAMKFGTGPPRLYGAPPGTEHLEETKDDKKKTKR